MSSWWSRLSDGLRANGASLVGACDVSEVVESAQWHEINVRVREWLAAGHHGEMDWLAKPETLAVRRDPRVRYPWINGAVAAAFPYSAFNSPTETLTLGGVPGIISDRENGILVPAADPLRLAAAMREVSTDASLRTRLAEGAVHTARRAMDFDAWVARMGGVYRMAIADREGVA